MSENPEKECDPTDVVCKMEVLRHLQGLETQMGSEEFLKKYPEAGPLREKIASEVKKQQVVVDGAIADCGKETAPAAESEPLQQPPIEPEHEEPENAD